MVMTWSSFRAAQAWASRRKRPLAPRHGHCFGSHYLQRHRPTQLHILGLIDDAHAALAQDLEHPVIADSAKLPRSLRRGQDGCRHGRGAEDRARMGRDGRAPRRRGLQHLILPERKVGKGGCTLQVTGPDERILGQLVERLLAGAAPLHVSIQVGRFCRGQVIGEKAAHQFLMGTSVHGNSRSDRTPFIGPVKAAKPAILPIRIAYRKPPQEEEDSRHHGRASLAFLVQNQLQSCRPRRVDTGTEDQGSSSLASIRPVGNLYGS